MSSTITPIALTAHLTPTKRVEGRVNVVTDASGNGTVTVVIPEQFAFQLPRVLTGVNPNAVLAGTPTAMVVVGTATPIGTISVIVRNAGGVATIPVSIEAYSQG